LVEKQRLPSRLRQPLLQWHVAGRALRNSHHRCPVGSNSDGPGFRGKGSKTHRRGVRKPPGPDLVGGLVCSAKYRHKVRIDFSIRTFFGLGCFLVQELLQDDAQPSTSNYEDDITMKSKFFLALALAGMTLPGTNLHAQTSTWTIDTAHSSANFQVRHM